MKQNRSSYSSLFLGLIGFTVLYQLMFNTIVWRALQKEDAEKCGGALGDSADSSPQCVELRLFRNWEEGPVEPSESDEELRQLLEVDDDITSPLKSSLRGFSDDITSPLKSTLRGFGEADKQEAPDLPVIPTEPVESDVSAPATSMNEMADRLMGLQDQLQARLEQLLVKHPEFNETSDLLTSDITNFKKRIDSRKQSINDLRKLLDYDIPMQLERNEDAKLDSAIELDLGQPSSKSQMTAWASELIELEEKMKTQQRDLLAKHAILKERDAKSKEQLSNSSGPDDHMTRWATDLMHLQERLEARQTALLAAHSQHTTLTKGEPVDVAKQKGASLLDEISQLHLDMCKDPSRRGYPACAKILAVTQGPVVLGDAKQQHLLHVQGAAAAATHLQNLNDKMAEQKEEHHAWQAVISTSITDLNRELCKDLRRRGYPSCAQFVEGNASSVPVVKDTGELKNETTHVRATSAVPASAEVPTLVSPASSGFLAPSQFLDAHRLHWSPVRNWASIGKDAGLVSLKREELRGLKWAGMIPKVACVTAVPKSHAAKARMSYFINNFMLQQYEGPRELILVYHRDDIQGANLVKKHADGVFIKGVAAMGSGEFPSSTHLRYGAWKAEADIVAHWDFDEWHHPDRLAMQVRALAVTGRPASLLKQWTVLENGDSNTVFAGIGWEGSLVGEKKWMFENWHPMLQEEQSVLEGSHSHQLAQVAMPELSIYNVGKDGWDSVLKHFGRENTVDISEEELAAMEKRSDEHDEA